MLPHRARMSRQSARTDHIFGLTRTFQWPSALCPLRADLAPSRRPPQGPWSQEVYAIWQAEKKVPRSVSVLVPEGLRA